MKLFAYSVYDQKAKVFSPPLFHQHDSYAVRQMTDVVRSGSSSLSKYPEDFSLYKVGEFEDTDGKMAELKPMELVVNLSSLKEAKHD